MKLHKIEAGRFHTDGGAVFGVVPKKVWEKRYPCNEENFCTLAMRCLLIDTGDKRILIDTGVGRKHLESLKYYDFQEIIDLGEKINELGYACEDITDVVLTHLHFDHCGGCTQYTEDKELALTFPNATHWVTKSQWENYLHPNVREKASYFPENMIPVYDAGKLKLIDENQWLCPEVELRIFNGHTVGQIVCYIHDENRTIVYAGDVIPIAANIPIAWISAFDTNPLAAMEEKEKLLCEAAEKNQVILFEHDAYTECCTVKCVNGRYSAGETLSVV